MAVDDERTGPGGGPEGMRTAVRDYVATLHATYLDHVSRLPPGERAALPLGAAGELTVVAAAARGLHLVATTERLPPPTGPEVELRDEHAGVAWTLRFFDPSVLPALGLLPDDGPDAAAQVRRVLGLGDVAYHLRVDVGGGLGGHHAQHSGVALANQHAGTVRDVERLRQALPRHTALVDELATCVRLELDRSAALLAADLTGGRLTPTAGTSAAACLRAVLVEVRG